MQQTTEADNIFSQAFKGLKLTSTLSKMAYF